jgi:polysaccharide export outer membrane protein
MNLALRAARTFMLAATAFVVTACASNAPLPAGTANYAAEADHEYQLGPGDRVRLNVFGEEALSGEFLISNRGNVAVPLVGDVKAGGLTIEAFEETVKEKLVATDMVRTPRVSVDVLAYRPFYILGEVSTPGQYPYALGMTLTKAVATAGGFTYRANSNVVYVTREGSALEMPLRVTAATWIGPGDTIRIAERSF